MMVVILWAGVLVPPFCVPPGIELGDSYHHRRLTEQDWSSLRDRGKRICALEMAGAETGAACLESGTETLRQQNQGSACSICSETCPTKQTVAEGQAVDKELFKNLCLKHAIPTLEASFPPQRSKF